MRLCLAALACAGALQFGRLPVRVGLKGQRSPVSVFSSASDEPVEEPDVDDLTDLLGDEDDLSDLLGEDDEDRTKDVLIGRI